MKNLLIISPYFPPSNGADMHRVRMSLPYFNEFGWAPEVVTVHPQYSDLIKDPLLSLSVPEGIPVHHVEALPKKWTAKIGLGSLALRSLWFYKKKVDQILKEKKVELIYFSTTQFPVCILGSYWKKKFGIPYIIDMQDPWHSTYYLNKPREERPAKYWFSYRLNKYLEPIAMKDISGIISVSEAYIKQLKERYNFLMNVPGKTLTFGYCDLDFTIAKQHFANIKPVFDVQPDQINIVYVGRGGFDMGPAVRLLFAAFKELLNTNSPRMKDFRFHFVGTSYAPDGQGVQTIIPLAKELGIADYVYEKTDRVTLYQSIKAMQTADGLVIPGSDDPSYTASKLYPYILAGRPLIGIFHKASSAFNILRESNAGKAADLSDEESARKELKEFLIDMAKGDSFINTNWKYLESFSAKRMTEAQCDFFNLITC